jgi:hypothetical protein
LRISAGRMGDGAIAFKISSIISALVPRCARPFSGGDGSQSNPRLDCMSDIETRWLEAGAISVGMTHRQVRYV